MRVGRVKEGGKSCLRVDGWLWGFLLWEDDMSLYVEAR